MKILLLSNTKLDISKNCKEAVEYFAKRDIQLEFSNKLISIPVTIKEYLKRQGFNPTTGKAELVSYFGVDDKTVDSIKKVVPENIYDICMFVWDMDTVPKPNGVITSFTTQKSLYPETELIQLALNKYLVDTGGITNRVTHEIMHALCYMANKKGYFQVDEMDMTKDGKAFYKNDDPNAPDGNYARTFANLKPFLNSLKKKYKYFSEAEVKRWQLEPELWTLLDKMRGECGFPFNINSGKRSKAENDSLKDSVSDSAHLTGLAVDIAVRSSYERFKMVQVALANGVNRIGIGETFVHLDIDKSKVGNVMWHYYK